MALLVFETPEMQPNPLVLLFMVKSSHGVRRDCRFFTPRHMLSMLAVARLLYVACGKVCPVHTVWQSLPCDLRVAKSARLGSRHP